MNQPDEAEFPHGWVLQRPSYGFHRTFTRVVGRAAMLGEYSRLSRQVRSGGAERITDTAWRVMTDTGETVVLRCHPPAGPAFAEIPLRAISAPTRRLI